MTSRFTFIASLAPALLAGSLGLTPAALAAADQFQPESDASVTRSDVLVYQVRLRLLPGNSQFLDGLDTAIDASKLKLTYLDEPSCARAPYANLYVRSVANGRWYSTELNSNVLSHTAGAFNAVRIDFQNPYGPMTCDFRLFAVEGGGTDQPDTPWGPGVRVGGIQFNGGFLDTVAVEIDPARKIRGFRIALPEFCPQVDILEAGTITEGVFEPGNLLDGTPSTYAAGTDGPIRARAISFALNGPVGTACYVPVYAYYVE
jgi:hypothetical protein